MTYKTITGRPTKAETEGGSQFNLNFFRNTTIFFFHASQQCTLSSPLPLISLNNHLMEISPHSFPSFNNTNKKDFSDPSQTQPLLIGLLSLRSTTHLKEFQHQLLCHTNNRQPNNSANGVVPPCVGTQNQGGVHPQG